MLLCVHQLVASCVCRLFGAEQASRLWVFSAFLLKTAASEKRLYDFTHLKVGAKVCIDVLVIQFVLFSY